MNIENVGYHYQHNETFRVDRPYGSGDYMLLLLKTSAYFFLNGQRQHANADSMIVYRKGTPQQYGAVGTEYINDWIHFELSEEEERWIENKGIRFDVVLPVGDTTEFSGLIKHMFYERYSENRYRNESCSLYLELLLLKLAERLTLSDHIKENAHYREFVELRNEIYCNPAQNWDIDQICRKMNLSRSYLQHLYKAFFRTTITEDVTRSRMEHAKYLLSGNEMTVATVARMCGYHSEVHFMRQFKQTEGVTPTQFRLHTHISADQVMKSKTRPPFSLKR